MKISSKVKKILGKVESDHTDEIVIRSTKGKVEIAVGNCHVDRFVKTGQSI